MDQCKSCIFDWLRYYRSISNSHRVAKFAGFVNLFISFYSHINIFSTCICWIYYCFFLSDWLGDTKTIRPFALKGHGSIGHSASPHGLLSLSYLCAFQHSKITSWLRAVHTFFFLVASYTLSLLQVYFEPATLLNRAATTPTLFDKCVGSLTSHGIFRVEGIVRRDLQLIVLIREDLKV